MVEKCENFFMNVVKFMDLYLAAAKDFPPIMRATYHSDCVDDLGPFSPQENETREKAMMAQARAKARADAKAGIKPQPSISEGVEMAPTTPQSPSGGIKAEDPPPAAVASSVEVEPPKEVPKKKNLQEQIAMKAAAKLKQMKLKKAAAAEAAAAAEPDVHVTSS